MITEIEQPTNVITITTPQSEDLAIRGSAVITRASAIEITDGGSYLDAGNFAVELKNAVKAVEIRFKPACEAAHRAHKEMTRLRSDALAPFERAHTIIADKQRKYKDEERARVRAEEQRIAELQRKEAEKLRAREVKKLEKAGDTEMAAAVKAAPVAVVPVVIAADIPKVAGQQNRQTWKFRITDPNIIPREYLVPNETMLGGVARSTKGQVTIPGVEFYPEDSGF